MSEYVIVVVLVLVAVGAVAFPLLVGVSRYGSDEELEVDVERYRSALRAGTVCGQCSEANEAGSSYCRECGARVG